LSNWGIIDGASDSHGLKPNLYAKRYQRLTMPPSDLSVDRDAGASMTGVNPLPRGRRPRRGQSPRKNGAPAAALEAIEGVADGLRHERAYIDWARWALARIAADSEGWDEASWERLQHAEARA
jgi:hypothetical protein